MSQTFHFYALQSRGAARCDSSDPLARKAQVNVVCHHKAGEKILRKIRTSCPAVGGGGGLDQDLDQTEMPRDKGGIRYRDYAGENTVNRAV